MRVGIRAPYDNRIAAPLFRGFGRVRSRKGDAGSIRRPREGPADPAVDLGHLFRGVSVDGLAENLPLSLRILHQERQGLPARAPARGIDRAVRRTETLGVVFPFGRDGPDRRRGLGSWLSLGGRFVYGKGNPFPVWRHLYALRSPEGNEVLCRRGTRILSTRVRPEPSLYEESQCKPEGPVKRSLHGCGPTAGKLAQKKEIPEKSEPARSPHSPRD